MIKSFLKNKIVITIIVVFIILIGIYIFILNIPLSPPELYIKTGNSSSITCIKGGFDWHYMGRSAAADALLSPNQITYTNDNTIYVSPNQKLSFNNSGRCKMYNEDIRYYDEELNETILDTNLVPVVKNITEVSFNAPVKSGTYILSINMNYYNKGTAQYSVKIVVNDDISSLEQYANTYIGDNSKVSAILDLLPYNNLKNGIELNTANAPYGLTVNYSAQNLSLKDLEFNTLALFTLIQNVDVITYNINNEEKTDTLSITRDEIKKMYNLTTQDLKGYVNGSIKNKYAYTNLENLSIDYKLEDAIKDNCFVVTYIRESNKSSNKEYNREVLDNFVKKVTNKEAAFIRMVSPTIEGDLIIRDVQYSDSIFTITTDSTRDKFSAESDRKYITKTYNNIDIGYGENNNISSISLYNGNAEMYKSQDVYGIYIDSSYIIV